MLAVNTTAGATIVHNREQCPQPLIDLALLSTTSYNLRIYILTKSCVASSLPHHSSYIYKHISKIRYIIIGRYQQSIAANLQAPPSLNT